MPLPSYAIVCGLYQIAALNKTWIEHFLVSRRLQGLKAFGRKPPTPKG